MSESQQSHAGSSSFNRRPHHNHCRSPEFSAALFLTTLLQLTLVTTATVCCWMMWAIVYLAQMNPLIVPILNETE
ncbi:V-type proton ATPase subunit e1 [Salvia divinorum]|uniref:V-type proton ATPase subunit e1 n=1 Tax=Salvia divinorum TaxID=28513 RepID=A0ABD1I3T2_SALDI